MKPKPSDVWVFVSIFVWLCAVVAAVSIKQTNVGTGRFGYVAVSCLAGAACGVCFVWMSTWRNQWRSVALIAITVVGTTFTYWMTFGFLASDQRIEIVNRSDWTVVPAIDTWFLVPLVFAGIGVACGLVGRYRQLLWQHRKWTIGVTLVLGFAAVLARNILVSFNQREPAANYLLAIPTMMIFVLFGGLLSNWLLRPLTDERYSRTKAILLAIVCMGMMPYCTFVLCNKSAREIGDSAWLLLPFFSLTFLPSVFLSSAVRQPFHRLLSIWSLVPIVIGIGILFAAVQWVDVSVLVKGGITQGSWQHALLRKRTTRLSGGAVSPPLIKGLFEANIRGSQDADCLMFLSQEKNIYELHISGIRPDIKTDSLPNGIGTIVLEGGHASASQVQEICRATTILWIRNCRLDDGSSEHLANVDVYLSKDRNDSDSIPVRVMLENIRHKSDKTVWVSSWSTTQDWEAIVRASQHRLIQIRYLDTDEEGPLNSSMKMSLANVQAGWYFDDTFGSEESLEQRVRYYQYELFLLDTDISASLSGSPIPDQGWQFVISRDGISGRRSMNDTGADGEFSLRHAEENFHWVYEKDPSGRVQSILLPDLQWVEANVDSLKSVTTLRLDMEDVIQASPSENRWAGNTPNLNCLVQLTKLKQLYLPLDWALERIDTIGRLPQLQHLQFAMPVNPPATGTFSNLTNLQSIHIAGEPTQRMLRELATLKKLKNVLIVESDVLKTIDNDTIRKSLPGVNVLFTKEGSAEAKPQVSQAWLDHRQKIKRRLRQSIANKLENIQEEKNSP